MAITENSPAYMASLDVSTADNLDDVARAILQWSDGRFWNYVPGVFIVRSHQNVDTLVEALNVEFPSLRFLITPMDPTKMNGMFSTNGWVTLVFDVFGDLIDDIALAKGWNVKAIRKDQLEYRKKQIAQTD